MSRLWHTHFTSSTFIHVRQLKVISCWPFSIRVGVFTFSITFRSSSAGKHRWPGSFYFQITIKCLICSLIINFPRIYNENTKTTTLRVITIKLKSGAQNFTTDENYSKISLASTEYVHFYHYCNIRKSLIPLSQFSQIIVRVKFHLVQY